MILILVEVKPLQWHYILSKDETFKDIWTAGPFPYQEIAVYHCVVEHGYTGANRGFSYKRDNIEEFVAILNKKPNLNVYPEITWKPY